MDLTPKPIKDKEVLSYLNKIKEHVEKKYRIPATSSTPAIDFFEDILPDFNVDAVYPKRDLKNFRRLSNVPHVNTVKELLGYERVTNELIYLPSACMTWHTNSNDLGYRHYVTFTYGDSVFRYRDTDGNIVDSPDLKHQWQVRTFKTGGLEELLWHTIASNGLRITLGFYEGD